jgi:hypothetical protein
VQVNITAVEVVHVVVTVRVEDTVVVDLISVKVVKLILLAVIKNLSSSFLGETANVANEDTTIKAIRNTISKRIFVGGISLQ